jgi:hydrogenase 3 maturation protease
MSLYSPEATALRAHDERLEEELRNWLSDVSIIVVAGIGNAIRCDDYVGVRVVEMLRGKTSSAVHLIECETVPESFVDEIVSIQPSHVLLIDAAVLGLRPGTAHLYDVEEVANVPSISTHTLPLRVFSDYVGTLTGARVALLLIEPRCMDFGDVMSTEVQEAAARVEKALLAHLP